MHPFWDFFVDFFLSLIQNSFTDTLRLMNNEWTRNPWTSNSNLPLKASTYLRHFENVAAPIQFTRLGAILKRINIKWHGMASILCASYPSNSSKWSRKEGSHCVKIDLNNLWSSGTMCENSWSGSFVPHNTNWAICFDEQEYTTAHGTIIH